MVERVPRPRATSTTGLGSARSVALVVTFVILTLVGCSSSSAATTDESKTVEYKLAVVDQGGYVAPDDPVVSEYAKALDRLEALCTLDTRSQIADYAFSIQSQMADSGVHQSLLNILQNVGDPLTLAQLQRLVDKDVRAGAIPAADESGSCAAYMTEYDVTRT